MVRLILTAILLVMLTACGVSVPPPSSYLVQKAIALQLNLTQQQMNHHLHSSPLRFEITQLQITDTEPLIIDNLPTYHVRGTYNLTSRLSSRWVTQRQNPFDVYLQRQKEGKTWRLARPQVNSQDNGLFWLTYLIE
ncbi:MAG TPA: hypothetical protein V6D12_24340 [Candidatus Obscuribacterales bacterium]